jgi:OOP family OmpA-OmpF porin
MKITLAGVALATIAGCGTGSPSGTYKNQGYLLDQSSAVVRAPVAGVCVRTSDWTPARAIKECDPDLMAKKPAVAPKPKAKPEAKAKPKPAAKPKKPAMLNITEKVELQNIPFDKAELTADNKNELGKFVAALRKATKARAAVTFGAVVVTGHTDRLGTLPYNMKLSEQRAVVAKDYLVKDLKVDQKLIFWEGKGPKQPIPVTKFCDNKMALKQLIECLGPNRRVTIEIVGTAVSLAKPKPETKPEAKPEAKPAAKPKP